MPASDIVVKGAREHNLRSVDLVLPRNQLICLTGVSGSGKSSLAFDTLYAEGQRRYVESLSNYARQFLGQMPKPDFDFIGGLSPSISISQKSAGTNPRSTVGTITEIYDYLRVLYARVGAGHCPECGRRITAQTREQIIHRILGLDEGTRFTILAPVVRGQKGEFRDLFEDLLKQGFLRARVDGTVTDLNEDQSLDRQMRHDIEVVVDRLVAKSAARSRLAEAVDAALKLGNGNLIVAVASEASMDKRTSRRGAARRGTRSTRRRQGDLVLSAHYACVHCAVSFDPPSPQLFSFNSPQGMCLECDGLGEAYTFDPELFIGDPRKSVKHGCIELIGVWKEMGRWRRHIYQGVADTVQRTAGLDAGTMLETPWEQLGTEQQHAWLWGTGDQHITFTWRGGASPTKYGGTFAGIIPEFLSKYRNSKSPVQIARLEKYMRTVVCPECHGQRLNRQARAVRLTSAHPRFQGTSARSLPEVCRLPIKDASDFFQELVLDATGQVVAEQVLKEIRGRLEFLTNVGLDYLALDRTAPTLSGGESQRIRLAGQIGCGLTGILYILDEPSIGLHPRDNARLLATLAQLRDKGNTVLVVEHDEETMRAADHIIDFGPGPGVRGGRIVAEGSVQQLIENSPHSVTGQYLGGKLSIDVPRERRSIGTARLTVVGATQNNLKQIDVSLPLGVFVCVTGVSGSGKSSLVNDILVQALRRDLNHGQGHPGAHQRIDGLENLDKLIAIDQSPIGRTPRSNPATYIKVLDDIRQLFAQLHESRRRGYKPGRFSFNVNGGRCQACDGNGSRRLEMDFLADVWMPCPVCDGHRFNRETLSVTFKNKSIANVLEMDVQQALELFEHIPKIRHKLQTLHDVGLDYLKLGQPSPTLSGGEAQRIKLARELVKKSTGRTLYLLDEPTTGLHFADIRMLLKVLHNFVDDGNTVLVVEHNLDVVKTADWVIDLGPDGGDAGGSIVATGTPEEIAHVSRSHTGLALRSVLPGHTGSHAKGAATDQAPAKGKRKGKEPRAVTLQPAQQIVIHGARQHNLKDIDVKIDRDKMTVLCGPSGSGKSSLAMDTLYAEGQRRYVESLSAYARQFVSQMQKPRVDKIEGLSPAIAIEQQNLGNTPRSTVGTVTEIYDYLRILFARRGTPFCPDCQIAIGTQSADEIIDKIMREADGSRVYLMAPVSVEVGQQYESLWEQLRGQGFVRVRVDGEVHTLDDPPSVDRRKKHRVEVVVDREVVRSRARGRIADSVEAALDVGRGVMHVAMAIDDVPPSRWRTIVHSQHLACDRCGRSFDPLTPHHFSFNSSLGWCPQCEGLGTQTGTNPAALVRDGQLTLAQGAILLWPNVKNKLSRLMLESLAASTGLPLDVAFQQLGARQRRLILHGTGDTWFDVFPPGRKEKKMPPLLRFQFKGLYPALEEAARLSPSLRARLQYLVDEVECSSCGGSRLRDDAAAARYRGSTIDAICRQPLGRLQQTVKGWRLSAAERRIAGELVREIRSRVQFLVDVGLDYLSLSRPAASLSGGEAQRIRLASQLGSGLCGVLYVLDEPTIGLHPRDNRRLIAALHKLRGLGNTLVVVEHDREVITHSDALLDFGPGAGKRGGQIVARGTPAVVAKRRTSVTGPYLSGKKAIPVPTNRRIRGAGRDPSKEANAPDASSKSSRLPPAQLCVRGARHNNLRNIDVCIPLTTMTAVTGVSGSGKSSLINDVLYAALARKLHRANIVPGAHDGIDGLEHINKVIRVDQQPLGHSPSSNPATYTGVFELIRQLFAQLPESRMRGYTSRRFSFNVPGGRCDDCEGNGQKCIEMHFLPDVWVECETCHARRYNPETLSVQYRGKSIADVLEMTCGEACEFVGNIPKIRRILQTLCDVGLDYLTLGQPAPTLSGGEAQRVKLAAELARPDTGQTLYLLDEPTTGLHFEDLAKLLHVLHRLVDQGNTVVVIEHNLDVIKSADWVIDLGPEAGDQGGWVVTEGTPEEVAEYARRIIEAKSTNGRGTLPTPRKKKRPAAARRQPGSLPPNQFDGPPLGRCYTGEALLPVLAAGPHVRRRVYAPDTQPNEQDGDLEIQDVGREVKMPWQIDGRRWHTELRVGRNGKPCRWDGRILAEVVDRIDELGEFSETNWNSRSIVEISGVKKSGGWFFHAITAENWLLKLKFRVMRNTFKRETLQRELNLKPLNQMDDLPMYGNKPRVRCKNLRGPWQEVELRVHAHEETDTPAFRKFLEDAVRGFRRFTERAEVNPDDIMPWKKLGEKWHFSRKGFPLGKRVQWQPQVLEELCQLLRETASNGQFLWNNQRAVYLLLREQKEPWATVYTKRADDVVLVLTGPKGHVSLGRVAGLGHDRQVETGQAHRDVIKLKFRQLSDLEKGDLPDFLKQHLTLIA